MNKAYGILSKNWNFAAGKLNLNAKANKQNIQAVDLKKSSNEDI